jgi:hypothetical protein
MNLICFPHYTCGGLLCDILNKTFSEVGSHGGINSIAHSLGKIGDADSVFVDYDVDLLLDNLKKLNLNNSDWIGTHCWPDKLDLTLFNQVIIVTTTTSRSKLYRWTRAYYHYYFNSAPWAEVSGQARIDKEKETAKNYLSPYMPITGNNIINIEFSEIVETSVEFLKLTQGAEVNKHMDRWKSINSFLYASNIWNSDPFLRFYEAESEFNLKKYYVYQ